MSRILLRSINAAKTYNSTIYTINKRLLSASSSDDEAPGKKPLTKASEPIKKPNNEAINKLNLLLKQIVQTDQENKSKLNLARPKGRNAKEEPGVKATKVETVDQKIVSAVKGVADSLGGNTTQTESELLNKLMNGDRQTLSDNLSKIVRGMNIDRENKSENSASRAQQVKQLMDTTTRQDRPQQTGQRFQRRTPRQPIPDASTAEPVNIFGGEALGIFTATEFKEEAPMNPTWDQLYQRELKLAVTHPPANYFQEQILWTMQGKVWKFPIDNEQGMEDEQNVYFADHVFLEEHLEPWCPAKGPLRHFMELVCVGLSKNPYMSVNDKVEHIKWYETYFESKKKLLKEVGALPMAGDDAKTQKQLETE